VRLAQVLVFCGSIQQGSSGRRPPTFSREGTTVLLKSTEKEGSQFSADGIIVFKTLLV